MSIASRFRLVSSTLALVVLAACSADSSTAPASPATLLDRPSQLFDVDSGSFRILADYMQGANHIMEFELGAALLNQREYQGSVYIRVSVPPVPVPVPSSMPCITSSIMRTEVRAGWTASVKKAGGCDKDIVVEFSNAARQRATFKWTYIFGLSKVDHGAVK